MAGEAGRLNGHRNNRKNSYNYGLKDLNREIVIDFIFFLNSNYVLVSFWSHPSGIHMAGGSSDGCT